MLKRLILLWPELQFCFLFLYTFSRKNLETLQFLLASVLLSIFWVWRQPFKSLMDKQKVFLSQTDPSSSVASVMELWWLVDAKFSSDQQCNVSPADLIFFQHFIFFFLLLLFRKHITTECVSMRSRSVKESKTEAACNQIYIHTPLQSVHGCRKQVWGI